MKNECCRVSLVRFECEVEKFDELGRVSTALPSPQTATGGPTRRDSTLTPGIPSRRALSLVMRGARIEVASWGELRHLREWIKCQDI